MEKIIILITILTTTLFSACVSPADEHNSEVPFKELSFFEKLSEKLDYQLNRELYEMEVTVIVIDQWGKPLMGKTFNGISHTIEGIPEGTHHVITFTPAIYYIDENKWFSCKPQTQLETIVVKEAKEAKLAINPQCDRIG